MAITKPNLTRVWAETAPGGNIVDPDVSDPGKFAAGWVAEIPTFENFNFLQQVFTEGLGHFNEQGIGVWDADTVYPLGGLAKGSDNQIYFCVFEQNGNDPVSDDSTNWVLQNSRINVSLFGITPANPDNSAAWNALLALDPPAVHFSQPGNYKFLSSSSHDADISITAERGVVIDCSDPGFSGGEWTAFSGTLPNIENLSANAVKGELTVTFASAPSLSVNDIFAIFNPANFSFSGFSSGYRAGEFCKVASISGNTVTLAAPLYDSYNFGDVQVKRLSPSKIEIDGLKILGDESACLIEIRQCRDVVLKNIDIISSTSCCIDVQRSYNTNISNVNIFNEGVSTLDGIQINNCQDVNVTSCNIHSKRHAVAFTGISSSTSIPTRNAIVLDSTLTCNTAVDVYAMLIGGNCEDCQAINCKITGGVTWQGKNNGYINCNITNNAEGTCLLAAQIIGGEHYLKGCTIKTIIDPIASNQAIIDVGGDSSAIDVNTVEDCFFEISDCKVVATNMTASATLASMTNRGSTNRLNYMIDNVTILTNDILNVLSTNLISGVADSDYIIVTNIILPNITGKRLVEHVGNNYLPFRHRLQSESGSETVITPIGSSSIDGSTVFYKWVYPRNPTITTSRSKQGYVGTLLGICSMLSDTNQGGTINLATDDGTPFTLALPVVLNWEVGINEI